jgi:hypothetical protein
MTCITNAKGLSYDGDNYGRMKFKGEIMLGGNLSGD